ncbi:HxlR family transcriptional regulator [Pedobacter psychrotolerans]|nr:helix-turn-helix domain-containing protein [Pedobacter psychrotolerans]TCO31113.1 HxlR family transcriptional regulator [Pedobacter psychrotolerans]
MKKQTNGEYQVNSNLEIDGQDKNNCPVTNTLRILRGKYKLPILELVKNNEVGRFGELRRKLDNVAQATLTMQLRELERDGIISRTAFAESPPRVEYALTQLGFSLLPVIEVLKAWNNQYCLAWPKL